MSTKRKKKKDSIPRDPKIYHPYFFQSEDYLKVTYSFEYPFWTGRKFAFDAAIICCNIAIEVEGWGHSRVTNYASDMVKYNMAAILGWRLLRFTPKQITSFEYIDSLEQLFHNIPNDHHNHVNQNLLLKNLRELR